VPDDDHEEREQRLVGMSCFPAGMNSPGRKRATTTREQRIRPVGS